MTAPYLTSPGHTFLSAFDSAYQQGSASFLASQSREEQLQLENRRLAMEQVQQDRTFQRMQDSDRENREQTALGRALAGVIPDDVANGTDMIQDPYTHEMKPRWQALGGTHFMRDWTTTPDYAAQTAKANQSMQRSSIAAALKGAGAPDTMVQAATQGTLPDDVVGAYLNAPVTRETQRLNAYDQAKYGAQFREAPAGTVMAVPTDPTNPQSPTRQLLVDPRTGRARNITGPDGMPLMGAAKGATKPTSADIKDNILGTEASTQLGRYLDMMSGPNAPSPMEMQLASHWLTRPFASNNAQTAFNAAEIGNQYLGHLTTGARLPAPEFDRALRSMVPKPGESAEARNAKLLAIKLGIQGAKSAMIPTGVAPIDPIRKWGLTPPPQP